MADAGEKRRSSADRKIHDGVSINLQLSTYLKSEHEKTCRDLMLLNNKIEGTKKGKKGGDRSDELVGKKDGKPTTAPGDLAGTLQTLFTQTEATDGPTLKPLRRPKLVYENTFRLWPYKPFNTDNVRLVLNITLEEMLSKAKYKVETASDLLGKVCEKVRARVLSFKFDR